MILLVNGEPLGRAKLKVGVRETLDDIYTKGRYLIILLYWTIVKTFPGPMKFLLVQLGNEGNIEFYLYINAANLKSNKCHWPSIYRQVEAKETKVVHTGINGLLFKNNIIHCY